MAETGKQSSYKKLFSNTLVFAIGSFSSKVLVLLLVPIYTNYLTTAELGVTDVLTQIANWIIPLVTMTITEAIIRFGLDKAYDKVKVFTLGNLICFFGLAVFGILLPIVSLTGIADKYIGGYSLILYIYVFTSSIYTLSLHDALPIFLRDFSGTARALRSICSLPFFLTLSRWYFSRSSQSFGDI